MKSRLAPILALLCAHAFAPLSLAQNNPVRNLDKALDEELSIDWQGEPLDGAIAKLRDQTQTNIVPNWAALSAAGIARDTPVTLHLTGIPYQAVIRSLLLTLPTTTDAVLNFVIGDNAVELTTNAELGKNISTRLYPVAPLLARPLSGKPGTDPIPGHAELLQKILRATLVSIGEPADPPQRSITTRDDFLAATLSRRAQAHVLKVLVMIENPARIGSIPAPAAESVRAKRAADQLKMFATPAAVLAAWPSDTLNLLLLPGARSAPPHDLDTLIDDAGIIEIGPRSLLQHRVVLCAYDLADLLRRRALRNKSGATEELTAIVADVRATIHADLWGSIDIGPVWLTPYANELIVQAPPAVHREIAYHLQELYK